MASTTDTTDHDSALAGAPQEAPAGFTTPRPLTERPLVRSGVYAWSVIGLLGVALAALYVVGLLRLVFIPLVLALFPAAVLTPVVRWLKERRVPPALASLVAIVAAFGLLAILIAILSPQVSGELEGLGQRLREGIDRARTFLAAGPFGLDPIQIEDLVENAREQIGALGGNLGAGAFGAVIAVVEGVAGLLFGLVALFFYLKDGKRMGTWLANLFPQRARSDAAAIGVLAWHTIGDYIRGQLIIALVDAVLIGIGIVVLGVPLALPLAVLVFFGALFPIVGAFVAGSVAVLVALATNGLITALLVLAVIVAVQQLEGHILAPVVLGRATELHPLAALGALAGGAVLLGVLGAFLAIPVAASVTRAVGYLRERIPG